MRKCEKQIERVCGRVFLVIFLLLLPLVWMRLFLGAKEDPFDLEARNPKQLPEFGLKQLLSGDYQDGIDDALADQMPASEQIRTAFLKTRNTLFNSLSWIANDGAQGGYKLIGNGIFTFQGHDYLLSKKETNFLNDDAQLQQLRSSSKYFNSIPIKNKYAYFIANDKNVDFNTNTDFLTDQIAAYYTEYKYSKLELPSFDTYMDYFYKNDHHWNNRGSYQGYKDITKMMLGKNEKIIQAGEEVTFDHDMVEQGSKSRNAVYYQFHEKFRAYRFALPDYKVYTNGALGKYGNEDTFFENPDFKDGSRDLSYGMFYGYDMAELVFDFNQPEKENLIIVGFSDTNPINKLVASHFNKTWVVDPRFCKRSQFESIIKNNKIDNILLMASTTSFSGLELVEDVKGYE
jgi:hypothetical protein